MQGMDLKAIREYPEQKLPVEVLRLSGRIRESSLTKVLPTRNNAIQFTSLMLNNLKKLAKSIHKEKNDKTQELMYEEIVNICSFCGIPDDLNQIRATFKNYSKDKKGYSSPITDVKKSVTKKIEYYLRCFQFNKFIEVQVRTGEQIEDGWYIFRNDADNMEGFYSTCMFGRVNIINKKGSTKYVGLGQISIK